MCLDVGGKFLGGARGHFTLLYCKCLQNLVRAEFGFQGSKQRKSRYSADVWTTGCARFKEFSCSPGGDGAGAACEIVHIFEQIVRPRRAAVRSPARPLTKASCHTEVR